MNTPGKVPSEAEIRTLLAKAAPKGMNDVAHGAMTVPPVDAREKAVHDQFIGALSDLEQGKEGDSGSFEAIPSLDRAA